MTGVQTCALPIFCEGASEKAYLQELNRYLDDKDYPFIFVAKPINNGHYKPATLKYKSVKKDNPHSDIHIWVDKDTYIRNDEGDGDKYKNKPKTIPDFLFSYNNFEDFLSMHLPDDLLAKWQNICSSNNHFENPMHSVTYEPLYNDNIINGYKKGEMPFAIDGGHIEKLLQNQENKGIYFKSDLAILLRTLCNKANI